jgi:hypothetical protein
LLWLVILLTITISGMNRSSVKHQTVMVNNIISHNNMNHSYVKPQTVMVNNIASNNNMNHSSVKPQTLVVIVAVTLFPTTISGLREEWFILLSLLYC